MPSAANLTRAVAEHRSATVELADHAIHLDLTGAPDSTQSTFTSTSTITLVSSESSVEIDLVAVGEPQVELDGERARATYADSRVRVEGLTPGREHTVTITAQCVYGHTGEGLHRYHDPEDGETYLYTHFEPTDARRVFACFDQPDLKAPFRISVSAPTGWLVRSNAEAEHSASEGAVTTTDFAPTLPISTYIVCVIAGPYHLVEDEWVSDDGRRVPLSLMCRPAMASRLPSADLLRLEEAVADGLEAVLSAAAPGVAVASLAHAWNWKLAEYGLEKPSRLGYSIGAAYPPDWGERTISIRSEDENDLAENQTFHIICGMWMEGFGYEVSESVRITATGVETFTSFPRGLIRR